MQDGEGDPDEHDREGLRVMAHAVFEGGSARGADETREVVYRHRLATRIWHGINALTIFVMLMSGMMIFNAHPQLYWGQYGADDDHSWLEIGSIDEGDSCGSAPSRSRPRACWATRRVRMWRSRLW